MDGFSQIIIIALLQMPRIATSHLHSWEAPITPLRTCSPDNRTLSYRDPRGRPGAWWLRQVESNPNDMGMNSLASARRWLDGGLSEGYGYGGPGVCLGDGQREDEGVPSHGGRGDALLWRMAPYLT